MMVAVIVQEMHTRHGLTDDPFYWTDCIGQAFRHKLPFLRCPQVVMGPSGLKTPPSALAHLERTLKRSGGSLQLVPLFIASRVSPFSGCSRLPCSRLVRGAPPQTPASPLHTLVQQKPFLHLVNSASLRDLQPFHCSAVLESRMIY